MPDPLAIQVGDQADIPCPAHHEVLGPIGCVYCRGVGTLGMWLERRDISMSFNSELTARLYWSTRIIYLDGVAEVVRVTTDLSRQNILDSTLERHMTDYQGGMFPNYLTGLPAAVDVTSHGPPPPESFTIQGHEVYPQDEEFVYQSTLGPRRSARHPTFQCPDCGDAFNRSEITDTNISLHFECNAVFTYRRTLGADRSRQEMERIAYHGINHARRQSLVQLAIDMMPPGAEVFDIRLWPEHLDNIDSELTAVVAGINRCDGRAE